MLDNGILVGALVCQLFLAWLGFRVSVRPPQTPKAKTRYEFLFVLVGFLGTGLIVWSGIRANEAQGSLSENLKSGFLRLGTEIQTLRCPPSQTASNTVTQSRSISPEMAAKLTKALSLIPQKITVTSLLGNQESFEYARELVSILKGAGWSVEGPNQSVFTGPVRGLAISVGPAFGRSPGDVPLSVLPIGAVQLVQILADNGIEVHGNIDPNIKDPNAFTLVVGAQ